MSRNTDEKETIFVLPDANTVLSNIPIPAVPRQNDVINNSPSLEV